MKVTETVLGRYGDVREQLWITDGTEVVSSVTKIVPIKRKNVRDGEDDMMYKYNMVIVDRARNERLIARFCDTIVEAETEIERWNKLIGEAMKTDVRARPHIKAETLVRYTQEPGIKEEGDHSYPVIYGRWNFERDVIPDESVEVPEDMIL